MKKLYALFLLFNITSLLGIDLHTLPLHNDLNQAITYDLNVGRFGDHLISLLKCLRFSWDYGIPVLYKSFKYSSGFKINNVMPNFWTHQKKFKRTIKFRDINILKKNINQKDTVFISSFYAIPAGNSAFSPKLYLALTEPEFKAFINPLFEPSQHFNTVHIPDNCISVAVHVRKGDYEGQQASKGAFLDKIWPLKFPPDSFYIKAIKHLSELYNDAPLYVFIFTDHSNPRAILNKFQQAVGKSNIIYNCRDTSIGRDRLVLEDFFSILKFDCFIHSMSSYSQCATIIGNFAVRLYPYTYHWQDNHTLIIDSTVMIKDNQAVII